jgi:queuosine precursor transporter
MSAHPLHDRSTKLYLLLGGFFVANALLAEMIGVKLFQLETALGLPVADFSLLGEAHLSFVLSVGVLPWPLVFILTDVVNDYYGVRGVRFLTLLTTAIIGFAFLVLYAAIHLPAEQNWWLGSSAADGVPNMQSAFAAIFGQGMHIIIGSLAAFVIGQLVDAMVFRRIKRATGERSIWLRATGSTLVSQLVDSVVVTYLAFAVFKGMSWSMATALVIAAYGYKLLVAILATPLVYVAHALVERYLGASHAKALREIALQRTGGPKT